MASSQPSPRVDIELETLIRARYPIIYVVSWEERRVEETLREICQRRGKKMLLWTYTTGMAGNVANRDPLAALDYIMGAPDQSVFVLKDFHPFINDVAVTRRLRDLVYALKTSYKTLIILSPLLKLPPELEKEITVVDYQLPTLSDLDRLLEGIIQSVRANNQINTEMTPLEREQILKASSGLTSIEAENVYAKSIVEKRSFDIDVILGEKEQIIRKSGILEYYRASEAFADVGGMDLLKEWMTQRTASFSDEAKNYGLPDPKGILLLGVQGCGKSLCAKAIASVWRLPLLRLDVGKVFAGVVGSSEENMRKAIATAESVAPCVAGDTRITLADGSERTIQSLFDSEEEELSVLSMQADWSIAPSRVKAVTRRAAPDLFDIRLRHGQIQATSNHLHPVLREGVLTWVRTDALQTSDRVAVLRQIPTRRQYPPIVEFLPSEARLYAPNALEFVASEIITPQRRYAGRVRGGEFARVSELGTNDKVFDFSSLARAAMGKGGAADSILPRLPEALTTETGYLLGLIASDGYFGKRSRLGFVNTDLSLHRRFASLLQEQFGIGAATTLNNSASKASALTGTNEQSVFRPCYTTYADNSLLNRLLQNIHTRLLEMPTEFLNGYLRGYFDGDGFISNRETGADPKVVFTVKKTEGNRRLRSVLQRVGFAVTNVDRFNIEITGIHNVQRFAHQIGSEHPCRKARLMEWTDCEVFRQAKDRTDAVPVGNLLRQARQALGMGSHQFEQSSSSLLHRYETGVGHPNRERLRRIAAEMRTWAATHRGDDTLLSRIEGLVEAPIVWSPVLSVQQAPTPEFVYDLVCDDPHNFIANGIVTHNCILWIDELEKGFSGTQSSGLSDGGTTSRVFGSFINWLQDKKAACFVVATSNDVSQLPPEMMRKGRFDEIFFVDLPAAKERGEIFGIHLSKRKRDPKNFDIDQLAKATVGYSGAEIESAVEAALFKSFGDHARELTTQDVLSAVKETVPLSVTMSEGIDKLRTWAETRARAASSHPVETTEDLSSAWENFFADNPMFTAPVAAPVLTPSSPYEMDADDADELTARVAALERKTATGLEAVQNSALNRGAIKPPHLPVVEGEGTGAPKAS